MINRYDPSTYQALISPYAEKQVYLFEQNEHGNCGVSGISILDYQPLWIILLRSPHWYGVHETMWGFWPLITSDAQGKKILFTWEEEIEKWVVYDSRVFEENLKILAEPPVLINVDAGDEA